MPPRLKEWKLISCWSKPHAKPASVAVNVTRMDISEQPDQLAGLNMTEPVVHVLVDKLCIIIGIEKEMEAGKTPAVLMSPDHRYIGLRDSR